MIGTQPINPDDALRHARSLVRKVEGDMFRFFPEDVREHVTAQFAGILKGLYLRDDGALGHQGIERTIMHKKFDEANSKKGKR